MNSILLLTNPLTYLLKKMKKKRFKNSQNDDDATPFKGQQKEKGRSSEINDLGKLNEQILISRYTENM